jgi:hypothetical protein
MPTTPRYRAPAHESANWLELQRVVDLREAARLSSLSRDTLVRRHRDKLIQISNRRLGMRVADALMLGEATA